jgi:hypothetical protein
MRALSERAKGDRLYLTFYSPSVNLRLSFANVHPGGVLCPA